MRYSLVDRFLAEYKSRFENEYGYLRPIFKEVAERCLGCGNPPLYRTGYLSGPTML